MWRIAGPRRRPVRADLQPTARKACCGGPGSGTAFPGGGQTAPPRRVLLLRTSYFSGGFAAPWRRRETVSGIGVTSRRGWLLKVLPGNLHRLVVAPRRRLLRRRLG